MKTINQIGLNKLFLWREAERIQTLPEAFSRIEQNKIYSRRELASLVFRLSYKNDKNAHPIRGEVLRNLFGLNPSGSEKLNIIGFNAFERVATDQYKPRKETICIGAAYRSAKDEDEWIFPFARLLCRFEVRTRLMLHLIGKAGYCLMFKTPAFFANPSSSACLEKEDESIVLFGREKVRFNNLLQEYRQVALGHWWKNEIRDAGYEINPDFKFVGMRADYPSMDKLNSTFKCSLFLFKYLGVLESRYGGWVIYPKRAIEVLGKELAGDFIEDLPENKDESKAEALKKLFSDIKASDGFVIVSALAKNWARLNGFDIKKAELKLDELMRELLYEGKVIIVARHQGQPRHGRGLFGDDSARKIKIKF